MKDEIQLGLVLVEENLKSALDYKDIGIAPRRILLEVLKKVQEMKQ